MLKILILVGLAVIVFFKPEETFAIVGLFAKTVGLLAIIAVLLIVIILLLANLGAYFKKIALGTTAFVSAGENLLKILPNVGGYRMSNVDDIDGRRWLVPEKDEEKRMKAFFHDTTRGTMWFQRWLWKKFGVRFISWVWPHNNIHSFDIRKGGRRRIEARTEVGADAPLRSRVVDSPEPTVVDSLLFLVPRPVYIEGVELAGENSKVNLLLLPVYRQVIPTLPVFYLKGDFFTLLDAAIEAAMVDFFARHRVAVYKTGDKRGQFAADYYEPPQQDDAKKKLYEETHEESPLTYSHWLKLTKAGEGSPIEKHLRNLNISKEYLARIEAEQKEELADYIRRDLIVEQPTAMPGGPIAGLIPNGIVPRFGFALVSFRVVEWEVHSSTVDLAKALLAKETELHTAEGVRQKAYGVRDAKLAIAKGESSRLTQMMEALTGQKVDPNVAAEVLRTQLRTENIGGKDSKIVTYVEGGASASVMVDASPPTKSSEVSQ